LLLRRSLICSNGDTIWNGLLNIRLLQLQVNCDLWTWTQNILSETEAWKFDSKFEESPIFRGINFELYYIFIQTFNKTSIKIYSTNSITYNSDTCTLFIVYSQKRANTLFFTNESFNESKRFFAECRVPF
jgi:hypothetical protein